MSFFAMACVVRGDALAESSEIVGAGEVVGHDRHHAHGSTRATGEDSWRIGRSSS
jgi:hypothetical protein